jgi:3-phosphoshikimate 1-carboxyvinyltransferase
MQQAKIYPGKPSGSVKIPASKSMAHRAVICATLAKGTSKLTNLTLSNDIRATLEGMRCLGAKNEFTNDSGDTLLLTGSGTPKAEGALTVDCGESGSTLRFFIPIFSLTGKPVRFIGHGRLPERPQTVYQEIFARQGLRFDKIEGGWEVEGALAPGDYHIRGDISSQFISGLLFALPLLPGDSTLHIEPPFESRSYVELTLTMQQKFGVSARWLDEYTLFLPGNQHYTPCDTPIEGDFSQLAFFAVLGAINSEITLQGVDTNSAQGDRKIIEFVRQTGAKICESPAKDGYIVSSAKLSAIEADLADCPDLGPILTVLAACADGETRLYNAGRLRIKESDRIADVEEELRRCGVKIRSTETEMFITGGSEYAANYQSDEPCDSHNDHRIVMALAILATVCQKPLTILGSEAINKSYPNFFLDLQNLGIKVEISDVE